MSREMKVRALDRNNNKWITSTIAALANGESSSWTDVDMDTVSEYTGRKDKNGTKIFDGDILRRKLPGLMPKYNSNGNHYKVVQWKDSKSSNGWNVAVTDHWEVIGNIYENPGLIQ